MQVEEIDNNNDDDNDNIKKEYKMKNEKILLDDKLKY
jgi:hypothetical protein